MDVDVAYCKRKEPLLNIPVIKNMAFKWLLIFFFLSFLLLHSTILPVLYFIHTQHSFICAFLPEKMYHFSYNTDHCLTHCGLVMPYGDNRSGSALAQVMHCCLMAPSHYLIQFVDLSWKGFCGIHLRANSQVLKISFCKNEFENHICKITSTSPRGHELNQTIALTLVEISSFPIVCTRDTTAAVLVSIHFHRQS